MTNLDMLLLKGASASDPEEYLQELRYTILTKGIPANSEGMVCLNYTAHCTRARPLLLPSCTKIQAHKVAHMQRRGLREKN